MSVSVLWYWVVRCNGLWCDVCYFQFDFIVFYQKGLFEFFCLFRYTVFFFVRNFPPLLSVISIVNYAAKSPPKWSGNWKTGWLPEINIRKSGKCLIATNHRVYTHIVRASTINCPQITSKRDKKKKTNRTWHSYWLLLTSSFSSFKLSANYVSHLSKSVMTLQFELCYRLRTGKSHRLRIFNLKMFIMMMFALFSSRMTQQSARKMDWAMASGYILFFFLFFRNRPNFFTHITI